MNPEDRERFATQLRQRELIALRWQDVDWSAGLIRVRRNPHARQARDAEEPTFEPRVVVSWSIIRHLARLLRGERLLDRDPDADGRKA